MSRIFVVSLLTIALAGLCLADSHEKPAYQKAAAIQDLMEVMVKPSMDKIQAMSKAGGPANKDEWKEANSAASLLVEAAQLMGIIYESAEKRGFPSLSAVASWAARIGFSQVAPAL